MLKVGQKVYYLDIKGKVVAVSSNEGRIVYLVETEEFGFRLSFSKDKLWLVLEGKDIIHGSLMDISEQKRYFWLSSDDKYEIENNSLMETE